MKTSAVQKRGNKKSSTLIDVPKKMTSGKSESKFVDNRPESLAQRKLQQSIQNTSRLFKTGGELLHSADQKTSAHTERTGTNDQPIQYALRSREAFENGLTPSEAQQQQLGIIAGNLENYHLIDTGADQDFQLRLGALKSLLTSIHQWFDLFKTGDIDSVANTTYLKTVYGEAEQEHQDLIVQISQTQHLPVNTQGMHHTEVEKVTRIWTDLLAGSGNLEIRETAQGFRNRMLAAFARLLEGQFGRNMLEDLNMDRGGGEQKLIVGDNFGNEMGNKEKPESEAIPRSSIDVLREKAHRMKGSTEDNARQDLPVYDGVGDQFNPVDFHDFLIGNDQTDLVKWGNEARKKGTGTGSFVRIAQDGGGYNIGENDSQIIMPEFVTLGHELGHAQRLLRGAPLHSEQLDEMGVTDEAERLLWNNPEEYVNINAVENRIRDEHQLPIRKYHVGDMNSLHFERNRAQFTNEYIDWLDTLTPYQRCMTAFHPVGVVVINYQTEKPNWADPLVFQQANDNLHTLQKEMLSETDFWRRSGVFLQQNPNQMTMTRLKMKFILPDISHQVLNLVPLGVANEFVRFYIENNDNQYLDKIITWMEMNNNREPLMLAINLGIAERFVDEQVFQSFYLEDNRSVNYYPQLLTLCRKSGDWEFVHTLMKQGSAKQIKFFESGLTHQEFEQLVDPKGGINVEIEYTTINPKAKYFKNTSHIYVRKNMKEKTD